MMNEILEINKQIRELEENKKGLLKKLNNARAEKNFKCICGKFHTIKDCEAIHRTWEDYINEELWIICPENTEIANRMLFSNTEFSIPYEDRYKFNYNLGKQFIAYYKSLFKKIIEECGDDESKYKDKNNFYIEEHFIEFGLTILEI